MERNTQQRQVIRTVFETAKYPLKPQEVVDAAQKALPRLGVATVYRNINRLVEEGWLTIVTIPGDSPRYEVADTPHHHFFCCNTCKKVYRVDGCLKDLRSLTPPGFELAEHEMILYGRCAGCVTHK